MKKSTILWIILFSAFLLRILLAFYSFQFRDNTDILRYKDWAKISYLYGLADTYTTKHLTFGTLPNNQPPGSLYILSAFYQLNLFVTKIVLRVNPHTQELYAWINSSLLNMMLRLPAILADCLIAIVVWLYFSQKEYIRNRTLVTLLILFNPVFLFNSAFMGQMDAVNNIFFIFSVFLLIRMRYLLASILLALSLLVKISLVFVAPFFFYIVYIHSQSVRDLCKGILSFCLTFVLAVIPLSSNPIAWYVNFFKTNGTGEMSNITSFAFNLWWVIFRPRITIGEPSTLFSFSQISLVGSPDVSGRFFGIPLSVLAGVAFGLCILPILILLWRKGKQMVRPDNLFMVLALIAAVAYTTLPKMHDRYIYPSLILLSIASGFRPRFIKILVPLTLLNLLNLYIVWHPVTVPFISYSFMNNQQIQWYISVVTVATIGYFYWKGYRTLYFS